MADPRVRVTLVAITTELVAVEHGLWCDRCLLPSAARVTLARSISTGGMNLVQIVRCGDCE